MKGFSVQAPAKVNFFLSVRAKRPDGYHEIETWMQKLELADEIDLKRIDSGIILKCPNSGLPENYLNLAWQSAALFFEESGISAGIEICLKKKIPVAAGLGGGSSDAAAVLKGMNTLFRAGLSRRKMMEMAGSLGADVPFFVAEWNGAWATGIGEKLAKVKLEAECRLVLVNPGFSVSTKWVYDNFALTTQSNPYKLCRSSFYDDLCKHLWNDLESVTVRKYAEINTIKKKLLTCGADGALMSGSGPTVFGVFSDQKAAEKCVDGLRSQYGRHLYLTRPLCFGP